MSTRAAIARPAGGNEGSFTGRYHHWDGYPSGLGATLYDLRRSFFGGDTGAMLRYLIDQHPGGWSTINNKDLSRTPGFAVGFPGDNVPCQDCGETGPAHLCQTYGPSAHAPGAYPCGTDYAHHRGHLHNPDPAVVADSQLTPECYCHGSRSEGEQTITQDNAADCGVEWVYVLDGPLMHVLSSRNADGSKMIGMFGSGNPDARWVGVARVNMDDPTEPDWSAIEARG